MTNQSNRAGVDPDLLLDCVHCGLCLTSCPTYTELGTEMDGPRGRIYLMRALSEGRGDADASLRHHLDLCLDCRACESACPSGVQYGKLIEAFRANDQPSAKASALHRFMLTFMFPFPGRMRIALAPLRWLQRLHIDGLMRALGVFRLLPPRLRGMHEMLPRLESPHGRLRENWPAMGVRRARVALFIGCVADAVFPQTTLATIRVLQANGCEVWIPPKQGCCGAIHHHSGNAELARRFAAANGEAFVDPIGEVDAVIVNAAGCGATIKEYAHLIPGQAAVDLAGKVRDICEFLVALGPIPPRYPVPLRVAYHDACHLCHGQQIREQPRELLGMIPQLELLPLEESEMCCGAAGVYNLTQPEMAERLGRRKLSHIQTAKVDAVAAGNVGCLMQIGRYLRESLPAVAAVHPVDLLAAGYSGNMGNLTPRVR